MDPCPVGQVCPVRLDELGDQFRRYRLRVPQAVAGDGAVAAPLGAVFADRGDAAGREDRRCSMASPAGRPLRQVRGMTTLSVRLIEVDDRRAKAAIYGLNQTGRRPHELEEAWIVQALVREDGLSQPEVAELLGRHKSWVCRRLALLEKLGTDVRQDLEVGLLTPTAAREIARLPAGNQSEVVDVARREALSGEELGGVVRLLLESMTAEQKMFVLTKPREALGQADAPEQRGWDPRLSTRGNRRQQAVGGAPGPTGVDRELPGLSRLDVPDGGRSPGPGPDLPAAGTRRDVRRGWSRRPGPGDAKTDERQP